MRISTGYGSRPTSGGFETFSWYFMRISAIGLFFLAIIHLFINHVTTDVACTSYQLVAARYANPYWRGYYLLPFSPSPFSRIKWPPAVRFVYLKKPPTPLPTKTLHSLFKLLTFFMT